MKVATLAEVRNHFSKVLDSLRDEPIFVTRNGRIAAVIEPMADEDVEDYLLEHSPKFRRMLSRVSRQRKGAVSLEEFRKRLSR